MKSSYKFWDLYITINSFKQLVRGLPYFTENFLNILRCNIEPQHNKIQRFPRKETRRFFIPFDFRKAINGWYTPLCSLTCLQSALQAILTRHLIPDSNCLSQPKSVAAPTLPSKCDRSHCNRVDDAVSAIPTSRCKLQKKLFSVLILCCSSTFRSIQLSITNGKTCKQYSSSKELNFFQQCVDLTLYS